MTTKYLAAGVVAVVMVGAGVISVALVGSSAPQIQAVVSGVPLPLDPAGAVPPALAPTTRNATFVNQGRWKISRASVTALLQEAGVGA